MYNVIDMHMIIWGRKDCTVLVKMADAAAIMDAAGSRFSDLELIGRGSFGDVYKG